MPDQPKPTLADWLIRSEIDMHIDVEQEDSVRADWWSARCTIHGWQSSGGHRDGAEEQAYNHVVENHPPCAVPSPRTFIGVPLYCYLGPGHNGDHQNGGYTWPQTGVTPPTCSTRARWFQTGAIMTCVLPAGHNGLHVNEAGTRWNFALKMRTTPAFDITIPVAGADAAAEPEPPSRKPFRCPLANCGLRLDDPPPPAGWMLLAEQLGGDVQILQALTYLREHLETHSVIDFVKEISRLTQLTESLTDQLAKMTEAYNIAQANLNYGPVRRTNVINLSVNDLEG